MNKCYYGKHFLRSFFKLWSERFRNSGKSKGNVSCVYFFMKARRLLWWILTSHDNFFWWWEKIHLLMVCNVIHLFIYDLMMLISTPLAYCFLTIIIIWVHNFKYSLNYNKESKFVWVIQHVTCKKHGEVSKFLVLNDKHAFYIVNTEIIT